MKRFQILALCLFAVILSTAAFAQDPPNVQGKRGGRHKAIKLKKMDSNNDGQITRDEWKGRDRGFQKADRNNDGFISREEAAADRRGIRKGYLRQMDSDKDGQITRSEWRNDPETFNKFDSNNDGIITRQEMKGRRRKM